MTSEWGRAIRYGLLMGALLVALIILIHGLRHGWDDIAELGYWVEMAVIFLIATVTLTVFAPFQRPWAKP
jgi:hypothetical protein